MLLQVNSEAAGHTRTGLTFGGGLQLNHAIISMTFSAFFLFPLTMRYLADSGTN